MLGAFYAALVLWAVMLWIGIRTSRYRGFIAVGIGLMLFLNVGYFVRGQSEAIAFFVSIYDVLDNLGVSGDGELPAALATCPDNECSMWGDTFDAHPAWGVAFHDRFTTGPDLRKFLLFAHIGFNSLAFVLAHWQLAKPGTGAGPRRAQHRLVGRLGFGAVTLGTLCAVLLAAEHGAVTEYGGMWAMLGFFSMSFFVYGCAVKTVTTARAGDVASHRVWVLRYLGSMWGAFWLFRVMLFVLDPLLRGVEAAALLICIWFSAPLGIAIAEFFRTQRPSRRVIELTEAEPITV